MACFFLGDLYSDLGEYERANRYYRKGVDIAKKNISWPSWITMMEISIARARVLNLDEELNLKRLFEYYGNNKMKFCDGRNARHIGEILLSIGDPHISEAENWIRKAIEVNKSNGAMWLLGRDYAVYSEFFKRKGDNTKAKENLTKAIEIFEECGADGWVRKYEEELTTLA